MEMHSNVNNGKRYEHFRCSGHYPRAGKPKICCNKNYYQLARLTTACIVKLKEKAEEIAKSTAVDISAVVPPEILDLQRQIAELTRRNDSDLSSAIAAKQQRLESLIRTSELDNVADASRNEQLRRVAACCDFWETLSNHELTAIFQELIKTVVCSGAKREQSFVVSLKI